MSANAIKVLLCDARVHHLLQELADITSYTAGVAVLQGLEVLCLVSVRPTRQSESPAGRAEVGLVTGARRPAYCTAAGKLLLACEDQEKVEAVLTDEDLESRGPNSIIEVATLMYELGRIRRREIATDDQESGRGVLGLAGPVRDANDRIIAAIELSTRTSRSSLQELTEIGGLDALHTGVRIAHLLGYPLDELFSTQTPYDDNGIDRRNIKRGAMRRLLGQNWSLFDNSDGDGAHRHDTSKGE